MNYRVFIVEDEEISRLVAQFYLEREFDSIIVKSFENGLSALHCIIDSNEPPPDLILLDIYMPEMDGFEFLEQIQPYNLPTDIVMISSSILQEDRERAFKFSAVKLFLDKPLDRAKFQMIKDLLSGKKKEKH